MRTMSPTAMAMAPPEPPFPVTVQMIGVVIERIRPMLVPSHLRDLPGVQLAVDILRQRLALLLQARDFLRDVERGVVLDEAQLLDLRLQLGDRLLEFKKRGFHRAPM